MTSKRRRQTRNRRTTGYPPELHNEMVAASKARRRGYSAVIEAQLALNRMRHAVTALAAFNAPMDEGTVREIEREQQWQRHARRPDCLICEIADPMTPNHDPSPRCESDGYPHCTCDTCY